jgi:hypothetical protein
VAAAEGGQRLAGPALPRQHMLTPPRRQHLDLGGGFGFAVFDGGLERGVVAFVLVGVGFGEVGDGLVEFAGAAEVGGEGDAVAGAGGNWPNASCWRASRPASGTRQPAGEPGM